MKKIINLLFFYLIIGLGLGVFYREFTKFNNFQGQTILSVTHTHTLILGFIFFLIILLLEKNFNLSKNKYFEKWLIFHNIAFVYVITVMAWRGILDVLGKEFAGISHISGLGHFMLGISLILFVIILRKSVIDNLIKKDNEQIYNV